MTDESNEEKRFLNDLTRIEEHARHLLSDQSNDVAAHSHTKMLLAKISNLRKHKSKLLTEEHVVMSLLENEKTNIVSLMRQDEVFLNEINTIKTTTQNIHRITKNILDDSAKQEEYALLHRNVQLLANIFSVAHSRYKVSNHLLHKLRKLTSQIRHEL